MIYNEIEINKGDVLYWARIVPTSHIYDVYELTIRTVRDNYFVGIEKRDKQAFLFNPIDAGRIVFKNRGDALELAKQMELRYEDDENN